MDQLSWDGDPQTRAQRFLDFCDGLEEGGMPEYARLGRVLARDLIRTHQELQAERSARQALQRRCNTQQELLGERVKEGFDREPPGDRVHRS